MDLVKAAVVNLTPLASLGVTTWDYEHRCRVQVQRNGVTRVRPAISAGWSATFVFLVNLPEYVPSTMLHGMVSDAGRLMPTSDRRTVAFKSLVLTFSVAIRSKASRGAVGWGEAGRVAARWGEVWRGMAGLSYDAL